MAAGPGVRIGDADREAAASSLREHYARGRLTLDEFQQRLDAVFAATTDVDLAKINADLPYVNPYAPPWPPQQSTGASKARYRPPARRWRWRGLPAAERGPVVGLEHRRAGRAGSRDHRLLLAVRGDLQAVADPVRCLHVRAQDAAADTRRRRPSRPLDVASRATCHQIAIANSTVPPARRPLPARPASASRPPDITSRPPDITSRPPGITSRPPGITSPRFGPDSPPVALTCHPLRCRFVGLEMVCDSATGGKCAQSGGSAP